MRNSTIPKTHLFTEQDLHLYEIQSIYAACSLWLENKMENQITTYDLYVRDMPKNRNFMLLGGVEEVIEGIRKWRYSESEIKYLQKSGLATPKLAKYLANFKFSGDLYAMPEGTPFFPGEPIVRITAPLLEGNLLTMFLINAVTSNTIFLSKIIRAVSAARPKKVVTGGGLRAHSFESAMKGTRAGYIAGALSGYPAFNLKYNVMPPPVSINAYHAVIKSFPEEIDAMRAAARLFPHKSRPMVDTYDFKQGVANVIAVAKELQAEGNAISGITIDSGDLFKLAKYARQAFDRAGFPDIKIILASNLDEFKIARLMKKKVSADQFLAVTEISTVADDPKLEIVYKIAEMRDKNRIRQTAKFAAGKISYPGRKQVFRVGAKKYQRDVIGLEAEKLGNPLLVKMISGGKSIYKLPTLDELNEYVKKQVGNLPPSLLDIDKHHPYKVEISKQLKDLFNKVKKSHCRESE